MSSLNINETLGKAVEEGDVVAVRDLLEHGADPNYLVKNTNTSVMQLAMAYNNIEIIKLLLQYGANVQRIWHEDGLIHYLFVNEENEKYCEEIIAHIVKYNQNQKELVQKIYVALLRFYVKEALALNLLRYLLDNGLAVDDFLNRWSFTDDNDSYTPLHLAIRENRIDFVSLLLERGADIHKKTGLGMNCIWVSLWFGPDESTVKMLVQMGVQINERLYEGKTALHRACKIEYSNAVSIQILFKYGADPNILDDDGNPPLYYAHNNQIQKAMIEEIAKLKFEDQLVCPENLNHIQKDEYLQSTYEDCLSELQRMKNLEIYNGYSLYDVFRIRKKCQRLLSLTRNHNFVAGFISRWNCESFKYYGEDLKYIFKITLIKRDIVMTEESKLHTILKDRLPDLVICKIAHFVNEDLFLEE